MVFVFVLAISVGAALSGLLGWHVFLISTGQVINYRSEHDRPRANVPSPQPPSHQTNANR